MPAVASPGRGVVPGLLPWQLRVSEGVLPERSARFSTDPAQTQGEDPWYGQDTLVHSSSVIVRDAARWLSVIHCPWPDVPLSRKASCTPANATTFCPPGKIREEDKSSEGHKPAIF